MLTVEGAGDGPGSQLLGLSEGEAAEVLEVGESSHGKHPAMHVSSYRQNERKKGNKQVVSIRRIRIRGND